MCQCAGLADCVDDDDGGVPVLVTCWWMESAKSRHVGRSDRRFSGLHSLPDKLDRPRTPRLSGMASTPAHLPRGDDVQLQHGTHLAARQL